MNTTCPNCQTEFNIPDNVYVPGRKARCAICSYVFVLPAVPGFVPQAAVHPPAAQPLAQQPQPPQPTAPQPVAEPMQPVQAQPAAVHVSVNVAPQAAQPQQPVVQQQPVPPQPQQVSVQAAPQPVPQPQPVTTQMEPQAAQPQPFEQPSQQHQAPAQGAPQNMQPGLEQGMTQNMPPEDPFAAKLAEFQPPSGESFTQPVMPEAGFAPEQPVAQATAPDLQEQFVGGVSGEQPQAFQQPPADQFAPLEEAPQGQVFGAGDAHAAFAESAARHSFSGAGVEADGHFGGQSAAGNSGLPGGQQDQMGAGSAGGMDFADILGAESASSYDPFGGEGQAGQAAAQEAAGIGAQAAAPVEDEDLKARMARFDADLDAVLGESSIKSEASVGASPEKKKPGKGGKFFRFLLLLICLGGLGYGAYWAYTNYFAGGVDDDEGQKVISIEANELEKVRNLDVKSSGVKYEYVKNDKLGTILVLEGKVTNHFPTPKNRITVEARLFNAKGEVVKSQRQVCGPVLSPLQLSVLGQKELVKALNDRMQIMANNMGVQPGADVPFMVVFVYPPSSAVEFDVTVIDAYDNSEPPAPVSQ